MEVSFVKANTGAPADPNPAIEVGGTAVPVTQAPAPATDAAAPATPAAPAAPAPAPAPVTPPPASAPVAVDTAPAASIPTAPAPAPLAVVPSQPLPVATPAYDPTRFDDDNIGFEDVILPRINIVQNVGDLSAIFGKGEIVLNQQLVIHEPAVTGHPDPSKNKPGTGPLILTVLGFRRRQFTEKVSGGKLGMLLNTEEEVARNNGTLDYKEWKASVDAVEAAKTTGAAVPPAKRRFERLATALILIEKPAALPDPDNINFPYEFGGKFYALTLWSMKGTAYTHAAKKIFTAKKIGHLKKTGYVGQAWSLTTESETFENGNAAFVPKIAPAAKNSDEFRKFAMDVIGQ